jgi:hypothetical protein
VLAGAGLAAGLGFVLPGFVLMLAASYIYVVVGTAFLCALIHTPNYTPGIGLRLSPQDFQVFEGLTKVLPDLVKLMKAFKVENQ